jgi:hypothetical protein
MAQNKEMSKAVLIPPEVFDEVNKHIEDAMQLMAPYGLTLSPVERRKTVAMGNGTQKFVSKADEYSRTHSHLAPGYLDIDEIGVNFTNLQKLSELQDKVVRFVHLLDDTRLSTGARAFKAAREFYSAAKRAMGSGVQGSKQICEELGKRFANLRRKRDVTGQDAAAVMAGAAAV